MRSAFSSVRPGFPYSAVAGDVVQFERNGTGSTLVLRRRVQGGGEWEDVETVLPGAPSSIVHTGERSDYCLFCTEYGGAPFDGVLGVTP